MSEKRKEGKQATPKWLETIQLNSWEAELLISALVLYALFRVPDYIDTFTRVNFERGSRFLTLSNMIVSSINLLKWGYILHILIRGLWVASVGFSYVFPDGVKTERLKFQGKFGKELEDGSLVKNVLRLEELSSIIYGLSFLLFGSMLGVSVLLFIFIAFVQLTFESGLEGTAFTALFTVFYSFYLVSILILLVDFFSNGLLRRIDWSAKFYYPIARIFRVLTLSFLYRRSLLVLISNLKGWKAYTIPVLLAILIVGYTVSRVRYSDNQRESLLAKNQEVSVLNESYENLLEEGRHPYVTIQSDIVSENVLRVYVSDISIFETIYGFDTTKTESKWVELTSKEASMFLNKWLIVKVDTARIYDIEWFNAQHKKSLGYGYLSYIDIASFSNGSHNLSFEMNTLNLSEASHNVYRRSMYNNDFLANIHFFYDKQ